MSIKQFYGHSLPGINEKTLSGALFVLEGPDSSGRSTQISMLSSWMEQKGYAVTQVGIKRSKLVTPELKQAKKGNVLSPRTMSLFYATDFYDQLENIIIPSLRAGYVVLADRYIYTLMARDIIRGANPDWLESLYSMAVVPDAVYFFSATIKNIIERKLSTGADLDYWEAGMDLGLSRDWFESYIIYQKKLLNVFKRLQQKYNFHTINANRSVNNIQKELRFLVESKLNEMNN
jgi:dTMP kinase